MYKSDFVMCLLYKGNVVEEYDRKVRLPFGAEYKVRLKNKNSKRAACDLIVNGEQVARFILNSGETSDIERFLDGSLSSGKKFTFVSLGDSRVGNRHDIDNGFVEAHFYLEQEPKIKEIHHHHDHDHYPVPWPEKPWKKPYDPYDWPPHPRKWRDEFTFTHNSGTSNLLASADGGACRGMNASYTSAAPIKGATVRGKESGQKFREVSGYEFSSTATILKLMVVNGEVKAQSRYCSGCGRKRRHSDKYCAHCGSQY